MRIDAPAITGSLTIGNTTLPDVSALATTGSNTFKGSQTISGSILPAVNNTYDLGSPTQQFRHVYISTGSLYIDGTKVLGSTSQELQITTDVGQSFKILETGSDTITLQSADGNITMATSGGGDVILDPNTGIIALKGPTTVYAGYKFLSSDGNSIQFGNGIAVTGSIVSTVTPLVSGSAQISYTGITNIPSGIISSSTQLNTLGFASTGSNTFQGTQTVNGSLVVTGSLTAQQYIISSSVTYLTESFSSGSTKFGDSSDDYHDFTGSVRINGTLVSTSTTLISGSAQVSYTGLTNIPSGVVSGSSQVLNGTTIHSGSFFNDISVVSGSAQIDVMSTTNIARLATTGSNTFNGAIAIGGTNDGAGTLYVTASASRNAARLRNNDASYGTIDISNSNTSGIGIYAVANKHYLSGSLGVGTTSPSADLHISSTPGQNNPSIRLTDSSVSGNGGNTYISSDKIGVGYNNLTMIAYSYTFKGGASANNYVTIDTSGNFGVGTTTPTARLEVNYNTANTGAYADGALQISGNLTPIAFVGQSNLNPGLNRWGFRLRTTNDGDFSLYDYTNSANRLVINSSGFIGVGTNTPSHKLHVYDSSASGVRGLRIATDSSTVGPTIRMDYAPGGLRNWLIGTSYEYSNDFEIRVSNANSGDPGADGSARFILWADGGYSNSARSIGNLSSTSLGGFSSANVQRWSFSSLCDNTWRTLVSNVNGIHGILKISGTDAGTKNYGEWFITFSFPGYGVMNFVGLHYSGGGWNTGGFELTYSNTGSAYFLQFRNTSYYSTGNTAGYNMEFTAL